MYTFTYENHVVHIFLDIYKNKPNMRIYINGVYTHMMLNGHNIAKGKRHACAFIDVTITPSYKGTDRQGNDFRKRNRRAYINTKLNS